MRLTRFRVRLFRNVVDSTEVLVEGDVTSLVGKNESGKSTMLEALRRLNPVDGATFDEQADYPRWLLSRHRRTGAIAKARPITAWYELDDRDRVDLDSLLGPGVASPDLAVVLSRGYDNAEYPSLSGIDAARAVANAEDAADLGQTTLGLLGAVSDLDGIAAAVGRAREGTEDEVVLAELDRLEEELERRGGGKTAIQAAYDLFYSRLPKYFYFSDYSMLEGRINLEELARTTDEKPGSSSQQTARALLRLASTTAEDLTGENYEQRKSELEAVAVELTQQVFRYWKQNPNLRVDLDVDPVTVTTPVNNQYGQTVQQSVVRKWLEIRVLDTRHNYTNNLSQRSSGFRWFFSFLAAFTEFEDAEEPVVVLLDEPGLTLHGRAQADFLAFINERLAPAVQVLYTTHSPFMIETSRMDRVRIVEDKGPDLGAVVSKESLSVGSDSLFPIQAALGYDVAQHLFIGDMNLLVEGPSDLIYLDVMSRHLQTLGRDHLDPRWRILPAGSASNIPAFVTLIGRDLDVTVLVDSGNEGAGRLQAAMAAGRVDSKRLVSVGTVIGSTKSDIEDVFDVADYLRLYNGAFSTAVSEAELGTEDRVIKRIQTATGARFDHYRPAEHLLRQQHTLLTTLGESTLNRFESLIRLVNASTA